MADFTLGDFVSCRLRFGWGLAPADASMVIAGPNEVLDMKDPVRIMVDGAAWYGTVGAKPAVMNFGEGIQTTVSCVDYRSRLMDDTVFCLYNRATVIEDDPLTPGVDRKRQYENIPRDEWARQNVSRAALPKTPREIIEEIISRGETLCEDWQMRWHPAMEVAGLPLEVDASNGKKFGTLLSEIASALGLMFGIETTGDGTLAHTIVWVRRGEGAEPAVDAATRSQWEDGTTRSWADTKIIVAGDRQLHQVMLDLEPDWKAAWEAYFLEPQWLARVDALWGPYATDSAGEAMKAAKAREVTLAEYVEKTGESTFADYRRWQDVGRMAMPVFLYLRDIVYKAYRIPTGTEISGTRLDSLEIHEGGLLADVGHDATTGAFTYLDPRVYYPETKAYLAVKGAEIERLFDPRLNKGITDAQLLAARTTWVQSPRFQIDRKSKTFVFDSAQILFGEGDNALFLFPNRTVVAADHPLYNIAVPNANPTLIPALVKACLVLEAGRYSKSFGGGDRVGVQYVSGLADHILRNSSGQIESKIPYFQIEGADKTADDIAQLVAENLLAVGETFSSGRKVRKGLAGAVLSGAVESVNVSVDFSGGITEEIQLSEEKTAAGYMPRAMLERVVRSGDLFSGQTELRQEARTLRAIAGALAKARKPVVEGAAANVQEALSRPVGAVNAGVRTVKLEASAQAGDVIFAGGKSFTGVVVAGNADTAHAAVATQGIVPVRVSGPFAAGDPVSLETSGTAKKGTDGKVIGSALEDYDGEGSVLVPVRLGHPSTKAPVKRHPFEIYISTAAAAGDDTAMPKLTCAHGHVCKAHTANAGFPIAALSTEWTPEVGQLIYVEVFIDENGAFQTAQFSQSTGHWTGWPEQFAEISPTGNRWYHPIAQVVPAIDGELGSYLALNPYYGIRQLTNTHLRVVRACGTDTAMTAHWKLEPGPGAFV